jgi:hypothetical protein
MGPAARIAVVRRFNPRTLFARGEVGGWWDPSDLSTMFQEIAGTTPVTTDGQTVGKILDKSGRGNHMVAAADDTTRPLYKTSSGVHWLQFDGSNDGLQTAATINMSGTNEVSAWTAARKTSDVSTGFIAEFSASVSANVSSFYFANSGGTSNWASNSRGSAAAAAVSISTGAAPNTAVLSMNTDISGDVLTMRANRTFGQATTDQGTGNFGTYVLYLGRRGGTTLPFAGNIYGLIVRGAMSTDAQIVAGERYLAAKAGIAL